MTAPRPYFLRAVALSVLTGVVLSPALVFFVVFFGEEQGLTIPLMTAVIGLVPAAATVWLLAAGYRSGRIASRLWGAPFGFVAATITVAVMMLITGGPAAGEAFFDPDFWSLVAFFGLFGAAPGLVAAWIVRARIDPPTAGGDAQ